jgi:prolyl oligopeptidase
VGGSLPDAIMAAIRPPFARKTFMIPLRHLLLLPVLAATAIGADVPPTPKEPVTDEYFGTAVIDDYRWLENGDDPKVRRWCEQQNAYTRSRLDALPERARLVKRLEELNFGASPDYFALTWQGGRLFALKLQPPRNQPLLIALGSADEADSAKVIVDPHQLDPHDGTAIDFYVPSHDGRLVAVCLSKGGSEEGAVQVFETDTGRMLDDLVPRVNYPTGGGSVAWNADSSGFWYTRYPRGNERPAADLNFYQQIYFHPLGTPTAEDRYVLGKDFPRIAEIDLESTDDGRWVLATVANGDGGEFAHYLQNPSGGWIQITKFSDRIPTVKFGPGETLLLLSRQDAPRGMILRMPRAKPHLTAANPVVPQSEVVIRGLTATKNRLYVVDLVGGPSQMRVFDLEGKPLAAPEVKPISSISQVVKLDGDEVLYRAESFLDPAAWYRFDPKTGASTRTALYRTTPADFSDCEVVREFATSADGTRVPMNIIRRKGIELSGENPTLLYGYGGYSISLSPAFRASRKVWLERGGVFVIANLRGGGEFGEDWHKAGNLTHKQNVFDDFTACARHLIDRRYTNPKKLAIEGGSNGGLLMGAALTQHPELFAAVVAHVGLFDMLRVELHPNGAFNVTEFGTVKDRRQFEALFAYSPYHHVRNGTAYPAALFLTGHNDGRVDPHHSRKFTARIQAASSSEKPVLLRYSFDTGHGMGTPLAERIAQEADVFAFLEWQLGMMDRDDAGK